MCLNSPQLNQFVVITLQVKIGWCFSREVQLFVLPPKQAAELLPWYMQWSRDLAAEMHRRCLIRNKACCNVPSPLSCDCSCDPEWQYEPHNTCFIHDSCFCPGSGCQNNSDWPEHWSQHLEVVYNCWYLHALCFIQMHTRSNHRRDLLAALRCHIIQFTILGSIVLYRTSLVVLVCYLGTQVWNVSGNTVKVIL